VALRTTVELLAQTVEVEPAVMVAGEVTNTWMVIVGPGQPEAVA
jgi:hypothetical protein